MIENSNTFMCNKIFYIYIVLAGVYIRFILGTKPDKYLDGCFR